MPIRRAAATPTQEKPPSAAAEKDPEASSEESPSADEEQAASSAMASEVEGAEAPGETEPTENGEKAEGAAEEKGEEGADKKDDKCKDCAAGQCATHCYVLLLRLKDGYKYEKSKKKVKRTIPAWASVTASKKVPVTNFAGTQHKVDNILIEAIKDSNDRSGVSYQSVLKYIVKKYPGMEISKKKFLIKKAMKKHLEKGTIKQLKGKGLSGTFAIGKQTTSSKKAAQKTERESLGDALPLIITRLCEPKEASYYVIKKYLEQHFPSLNIENKPEVLKTALTKAVERGQLEQITGKGARGTFQLKRTGNQVLLKGGDMEDAITAAITAMNEPKTCSTTTLKKYLVDANKDRKEYQLVANLRRTLTKCKVLGWMEQITGHGFTGTYQLSFPFYPSPTTLYPEKFKNVPKKSAPPKRKRAADSSDEEEEEEEEDEESEDEAPSRKRKSSKRPPPKARRPPPTKRSRSASQSKAKGKAHPKKSVAKKARSSAIMSARKKSVSKKDSTSTTSKATPVKRGAPAKKPKTPAVKKLAKRGTKRPVYKESTPEEEEEEEEEEVPKETTRGSKRSKRADSSSEEEPAVKKPATKSRSRQPEPDESSEEETVVKKGRKSSKQSGRKSKRGKN